LKTKVDEEILWALLRRQAKKDKLAILTELTRKCGGGLLVPKYDQTIKTLFSRNQECRIAFRKEDAEYPHLSGETCIELLTQWFGKGMKIAGTHRYLLGTSRVCCEKGKRCPDPSRIDFSGGDFPDRSYD
jgi:hypothetical protein